MLSFFACKKDNIKSTETIPDPGTGDIDTTELFTANLFRDFGDINIKVFANGNSWDTFNSSLIKDISGNKYSYCHPDVEYFENGFNGFKYWMAFTPYFGIVGSSGDAILYENPTIVASNDGLNWEEPRNIINPLQRRPSFKDGIVRNNKDTLQGYWSDTDLLFVNNHFELFYRGNNISTSSLRRTCAKSNNNERKLVTSATRTIVKQESKNGIDWQPLEILYTSNAPETLNNNDVLSPSFVSTNKDMVSYEVLFNTGVEGYTQDDNSFVLKRTSNNGLDFSSFARSKIVHFDSKPWKERSKEYSPWHLQATFVDGYYFLYLSIGRVKSYTSDDLYIAYSKDGDNFKVYPKPVVANSVYRSCLFPTNIDKNTIEFGSIIGLKSGKFKYRKFKVNKLQLNKMLS